MTSRKSVFFTLTVVMSLFLAACGSGNREPAAAAIKAAEEALVAARSDAEKFVPDQVKVVENAIKTAQASFEKGNFDEALNIAKAIPEKVKEMNAAVAARKAELVRGWEALSGEMPGILDAIKGRLDLLKAARKLPRSIDRAGLERAEMHYEAAAMMWNEAQRSHADGNLVEVMPNAAAAKDDALEAMKLLEMQAPAAPAK